MRKILMIALGFFLMHAFLVCGCGDDESVRGPEAIELTADNAVALAEIGVGTVNLFANLGKVLWKSLDAILPANKLGDIGLCFEGASNLTWTDTDDDGVLSNGDSAELTFVDCAWDEDTLTTLSNGRFDLDFTAVDATSAVVQFAMNYNVVEQDERNGVTTELVGLFTAEADWETPSDVLVRFLVNAEAHGDPTVGFAAIVGGETQAEFGCFDFGYTLDTVGDGFTLSQPSGVYQILGADFLSIVPSGLAEDDLVFPDGDYPESGKMSFLADALPAPCAALGLGAESVKDNDSFLNLTATGSGDVSLSGEDATGEPFDIDTTWDDLS